MTVTPMPMQYPTWYCDVAAFRIVGADRGDMARDAERRAGALGAPLLLSVLEREEQAQLRLSIGAELYRHVSTCVGAVRHWSTPRGQRNATGLSTIQQRFSMHFLE